jgi:hypothetical protein
VIKYTYLPAVNLYIRYQDRKALDFDKNPMGWVWKRVHYIRLQEDDESDFTEYGVFNVTDYEEEINHYKLDWIPDYRVEGLDDENPYENLDEEEAE